MYYREKKIMKKTFAHLVPCVAHMRSLGTDYTQSPTRLRIRQLPLTNSPGGVTIIEPVANHQVSIISDSDDLDSNEVEEVPWLQSPLRQHQPRRIY